MTQAPKSLSVAGRSRADGSDTEELRGAVVHYRALFEALLEDRADVDLTDRYDDGRAIDLRAVPEGQQDTRTVPEDQQGTRTTF